MFDRFSIVLITALTLSANASFAQSNDPAWLDDLQLQMQKDKECTVDLFININEGKLGAGNYYEARVQCRDGRLFDAHRTEPEKIFTIKKCEIAVC